ncbi:MAG: hypothetical protein WC371_03930 [Parachlamydiales bacterium]|jgi:hypothetical protein
MARLVIPSLPPLALEWIKAQSVGAIAALSLKIFPLGSSVLGFTIASRVYLTERVALYFFDKILPKGLFFWRYGTGLLFGTLALHFLIVLSLPFQSHLIYADLIYILFRTALKILTLTMEKIFGKYQDYLFGLWAKG